MNSLHILYCLCLGIYYVACAPAQKSFYEAILEKCPAVKSIASYKDEHLFTMCKDWNAISTVNKFTGDNQIEIHCLLYFETFTRYCTSAKIINTEVEKDLVLKNDVDTVCEYAKTVPNDNLKAIFATGDNCQKICGDELKWVKSLCGISYYFGHLNVIPVSDAVSEVPKKGAVPEGGSSQGAVGDLKAQKPHVAPLSGIKALAAQVQAAPVSLKDKVNLKPVNSLNVAANGPDLNGHIDHVDPDVAKVVQSAPGADNAPKAEIQVPAVAPVDPAHPADDGNSGDAKEVVPPKDVHPGTDDKHLGEKKNGHDDENIHGNPGDGADIPVKKGEPKTDSKQENTAVEDHQEPNAVESHSTTNNNGNDQTKQDNANAVAEENQPKPEDSADNLAEQDKIGEVEIDDDGQVRPELAEEENMESPEGVVGKENSDKSSKPLQVDDSESVNYSTEMDGDSYFFTYFMLLCIIFIVGYVCYHNKQKILALILEGRRGKRQYRGARRPNSANYHKLDSNLEEAITSSCKKNTNNVIY